MDNGLRKCTPFLLARTLRMCTLHVHHIKPFRMRTIMKIPCTRSVNLLSPRSMKNTLLSAAVAFLAIGAQAATVTPVSVPLTGLGPITFDTLPTLATGWATKEIAGGNNAPANGANAPDVNQALLDAAVQTNAVADFTLRHCYFFPSQAVGRWRLTASGFVESAPI